MAYNRNKIIMLFRVHGNNLCSEFGYKASYNRKSSIGGMSRWSKHPHCSSEHRSISAI
jgi:hypothetical protein